MKVERTLGLIFLLPFLVVAAPEPAARRAAFATVPKQALVELKATVGKPFSSGLVFVNGKFLDPPYKIERYGTAIRINGVQVTNEIIPWTEFLKTQAGARIEKVDPPAGAEPQSRRRRLSRRRRSFSTASSSQTTRPRRWWRS